MRAARPPARREPWREAAPRRPHPCPRPQQRPRPPPLGPPGRRPRAPRPSNSRAPRARRPPKRGCAREGAAEPHDPRVPEPEPEPGAPSRRAGSSKRRRRSRAPRVHPAPPARCCGCTRTPSRPGRAGPRTARRRRPAEPSAGQSGARGPRDRACSRPRPVRLWRVSRVRSPGPRMHGPGAAGQDPVSWERARDVVAAGEAGRGDPGGVGGGQSPSCTRRTCGSLSGPRKVPIERAPCRSRRGAWIPSAGPPR